MCLVFLRSFLTHSWVLASNVGSRCDTMIVEWLAYWSSLPHDKSYSFTCSSYSPPKRGSIWLQLKFAKTPIFFHSAHPVLAHIERPIIILFISSTQASLICSAACSLMRSWLHGRGTAARPTESDAKGEAIIFASWIKMLSRWGL